MNIIQREEKLAEARALLRYHPAMDDEMIVRQTGLDEETIVNMRKEIQEQVRKAIRNINIVITIIIIIVSVILLSLFWFLYIKPSLNL